MRHGGWPSGATGLRCREQPGRYPRLPRAAPPCHFGTRAAGGGGRPIGRAAPRNRALWRAARRVGREIGLELEETLAGGGSDGNRTSLYTATLDGLGPIGGGAHATHEFILADSLVERCALLALILAEPVLRGANRLA